MATTKIITLIPSATEIISFLGLDSQLVGVSHECDFPEKVKSLKKLTKTDIKTNVSSYNIHLQIEKILENSLSVYKVDENSLKYLNPDVIITQDQCNVCAVNLSQVKKVTSSYLNKEVDMHFCQYINFAFVNFLLLGNNNRELLRELFLFEKNKNRSRRSRLFFLKTTSYLNFFILYICLYISFPHPWFNSF